MAITGLLHPLGGLVRLANMEKVYIWMIDNKKIIHKFLENLNNQVVESIQNLDGPVMFPECCYCKYCKAKFKELYKKAIPTEDWANPLWRKFIEFRQNSMAEFLKDAQKAIKKINTEGVIFLNAGGWKPNGWRAARDIQKLGRYQDFNGAEAFSICIGKNRILALQQ